MHSTHRQLYVQGFVLSLMHPYQPISTYSTSLCSIPKLLDATTSSPSIHKVTVALLIFLSGLHVDYDANRCEGLALDSAVRGVPDTKT